MYASSLHAAYIGMYEDNNLHKLFIFVRHVRYAFYYVLLRQGYLLFISMSLLRYQTHEAQ